MGRHKKNSFAAGAKARLLADLKARIIGQPTALESIVPAVQMFRAGLNPEGRPAGVFLLLGPTGVGKTRTVEALAEVLHGSAKNVLRVDCGEYQMEHEVAKLIGAPPGYLGHRETQPVLTQVKLNQVMSDRANIAIVLFDEIEKAAPSLLRLLLGVLDKGTLRLGDNTTVQFERSLIFLTSNLGAEAIARETSGGFGLSNRTPAQPAPDLSRITQSAVRSHLSPEFINRIDSVLTYAPLSREDSRAILHLELQKLSDHISHRLGARRFFLKIPARTESWLLEKGFSARYGARELKRVLHTHILQPAADLVCDGEIEPGAIIEFAPSRNGDRLNIRNLDETKPDVVEYSDNGRLQYIIKKGSN